VAIKPVMTGKCDIKQDENGIYLDTDGPEDIYIKPADLKLLYKRLKVY
jgi:hypothetical protein